MRRGRALLMVLAGVAVAGPAHGQRPWLTSETLLSHDSQQRTAVSTVAQYGGWVRPDITLAVDAGISHAGAPGVSTATGLAGITGTLALPSARLGVEAGSSLLLGAPAATETPLYHATARFGAGAGVSVRGRVRRERYTATVASLDTLVLVNTMELALDRADAPGWAGEVVARRQTFGDGNAVATAYAWLLAPLSRSASHSLRAGYAAAWQDAAETRWRRDPAAAAGGGPQLPGRYDPYYTPRDVVTHSVLLNGALAAGRGWFMVDGSVGFHAREAAPVLIAGSAPGGHAVVPTGPDAGPAWIHHYQRSFTPWRGALSLVTPADERTTLTASVEYGRTAYYRAGQVRLALARAL
jgi:hypothetical protein